MNRVFVNYSESEAFVDQQRSKGVDVRWDGWDMVFWKANPGGYSNKHGAYRNNRWGVEFRVSPDTRGLWRVPAKYVAIR